MKITLNELKKLIRKEIEVEIILKKLNEDSRLDSNINNFSKELSQILSDYIDSAEKLKQQSNEFNLNSEKLKNFFNTTKNMIGFNLSFDQFQEYMITKKITYYELIDILKKNDSTKEFLNGLIEKYFSSQSYAYSENKKRKIKNLK